MGFPCSSCGSGVVLVMLLWEEEDGTDTGTPAVVVIEVVAIGES